MNDKIEETQPTSPAQEEGDRMRQDLIDLTVIIGTPYAEPFMRAERVLKFLFRYPLGDHRRCLIAHLISGLWCFPETSQPEISDEPSWGQRDLTQTTQRLLHLQSRGLISRNPFQSKAAITEVAETMDRDLEVIRKEGELAAALYLYAMLDSDSVPYVFLNQHGKQVPPGEFSRSFKEMLEIQMVQMELLRQNLAAWLAVNGMVHCADSLAIAYCLHRYKDNEQLFVALTCFALQEYAQRAVHEVGGCASEAAQADDSEPRAQAQESVPINLVHLYCVKRGELLLVKEEDATLDLIWGSYVGGLLGDPKYTV